MTTRGRAIGIVCYASMGGSGIVATELAKALAARGHAVHVISADQPYRLSGFHPGLTLHRVETPSYRLTLDQRRENPLAEQSRAHWRERAIEHAEERAGEIGATRRS